MKIEIKSGLSTTTLETNDHVVVHADNWVYNFFNQDGKLKMSKEKIKTEVESKKSRESNWNNFKKHILPHVKKKYKVIEHQFGYKIITNSKKVFNYYPKGQRLNIEKGNFYSWVQGPVTLSEFEQRFVLMTEP